MTETDKKIRRLLRAHLSNEALEFGVVQEAGKASGNGVEKVSGKAPDGVSERAPDRVNEEGTDR